MCIGENMHTTIADKDFSAFLFCDVIQFPMKWHKLTIKYLQPHNITSSGVLDDSLFEPLNELRTTCSARVRQKFQAETHKKIQFVVKSEHKNVTSC